MKWSFHLRLLFRPSSHQLLATSTSSNFLRKFAVKLQPNTRGLRRRRLKLKINGKIYTGKCKIARKAEIRDLLPEINEEEIIWVKEWRFLIQKCPSKVFYGKPTWLIGINVDFLWILVSHSKIHHLCFICVIICFLKIFLYINILRFLYILFIYIF